MINIDVIGANLVTCIGAMSESEAELDREISANSTHDVLVCRIRPDPGYQESPMDLDLRIRRSHRHLETATAHSTCVTKPMAVRRPFGERGSIAVKPFGERSTGTPNRSGEDIHLLHSACSQRHADLTDIRPNWCIVRESFQQAIV